MGNILVMEDNVNTRKDLVNIILEIDPAANVLTTGSIYEAQDHLSQTEVDIFLIDLQLEDGNGLDFARELRKIDKYKLTHIVFITAVPTHAILAYSETHCYSYIVKPFNRKVLMEQLQTLITFGYQSTSSSSRKVEIELKNHIYVIEENQILYVEAKDKKLFVFTDNEIITVPKMTLSSIQDKLSDRFTRVHKAFIVNESRVKRINKSEKVMALDNGPELIPIGRTYYKAFMEKFQCQ